LYKYEKGMSFARHFDGSNTVSRYENGNTAITVLIYLSSCVGGATIFYPPNASKKKKQKQKGNNRINGGYDDGKGVLRILQKSVYYCMFTVIGAWNMRPILLWMGSSRC